MPDGSSHISLPALPSDSCINTLTIAMLAQSARVTAARLAPLPHGIGDADITYSRAEAVRDLILTMPARTLDEALVQAGDALLLLEDYRTATEEDLQKDLTVLRKRLDQACRGLASIIGVLIANSSVSPEDLVEIWVANAFDREFGAFEAAIPGAGR